MSVSLHEMLLDPSSSHGPLSDPLDFGPLGADTGVYTLCNVDGLCVCVMFHRDGLHTYLLILTQTRQLLVDKIFHRHHNGN